MVKLGCVGGDKERGNMKKKMKTVAMCLIAVFAVLVCSLPSQVPVQAAGKTPSVSYRTHVQNDGWQGYVKDGATAGTSGRSLRLEGIKIKLQNAPYSGGVEYRTHVQNDGWQGYVSNDAMSGTSGRSLRLEAISIRLTGEMANHYDIYYRVHAQNFGWMGWAKNGENAGTAGYSYRLEAIQIKLVAKGGAAPGSTNGAYASTLIQYRTHVQNDGWQDWRYDGGMSGTSGRALRLEGINIQLANQKYNGGIEYRTHVQNDGWQGWVSNGAMSGTSGRSLRLEGIEIRLTGEMANYYDVVYRVHVQNIGWQAWVKNGEMAGTSGRSLRLEGIEIKLAAKGTADTQVHTHNWQKVDATGHYEEKVVQQEYESEYDVDYRPQGIYACNGCGDEVNPGTDEYKWHSIAHMEANEGSGWHSEDHYRYYCYFCGDEVERRACGWENQACAESEDFELVETKDNTCFMYRKACSCGENALFVSNTGKGLIHHDAVTQQVWVQDTAAYEKCTVCGATR